MDSMHTAFKSENYRMQLLKDLRTGLIPVFQSIDMVPGSLLLEFKITPRFHHAVKLEEVYRRDETNTIIYQLTLPSTKLVMKVYKIQPNQLRMKNDASNHQIEVRYLKLFTDMVQHLVCPHFTLPIGHVILNEQEMQQLFDTNMEKGSYMVLLGEWADSTFNRVLREGISGEAIRGIIFQSVLTLHILHDIFPSFRHNDLHLSNILVQQIDVSQLSGVQLLNPKNTLCVKYTVNNKKYYINLENCPYRVLIWDMFYSSIDDADAMRLSLSLVVPGKKKLFATADKCDNRVSTNQYFDLHKFFDSLHYVIGLDKKRAASREMKELGVLIDLVVPDHLKCMSRGLTHKDKTDMRIWEAQHITPWEVLQHSYFDSFTQAPLNRTVVREYRHPRSI